MSRPKDSAVVDLSVAQDLTAGLIERLQCPPGKTQAFLRDRKAPALRVRVTTSGAKAYVFEAKLGGKTIRRTIGDVRSWTIEGARMEANRQRVLIDTGEDPRQVEQAQEAARIAKAEADTAQSISVGAVWDEYVEARKPRWGDLHYRDHIAKAKAGGLPSKRGTRGRGETIAGPLYPLMQLKLRDLTPATLSAWAEEQTLTRPTATRLSWRLLRGFLSWCSEHTQYAQALPAQNPAKAKVVREVLGKPSVKQDVLQREQLSVWFAAVRQLSNRAASAYLQTLLLTGARPGEILAIQWKDLDQKWKGLTIRDKVEGERMIPLTPHVATLLAELPKTSKWVFASQQIAHLAPKEPRNSAKRLDPKNEEKTMSMPNHLHDKACKVAGIEGLTLHGLRRSFKSLTEWLEVPAGVVAQIMGHKPSATAEKHYTVRPLDLLRLHHEKIEAWMLAQGSVQPAPAGKARRLRVVK